MASKNIVAKGTTYNGVESITLPTSPSGTATFYEISDTTALASDVASGKYFYDSLGQFTQGTASGGGGSNWTLLASADITASTTSTIGSLAGYVQLPSLPSENEIMLVHIRDKAGKRNGYFYGGDAIWIFPNGVKPTNANPPNYAIRYYNNSYAVSSGTYGVYPYSINPDLQVEIYCKYNSTNSRTVDGTYQCDVYKITLPSGMTMFT